MLFAMSWGNEIVLWSLMAMWMIGAAAKSSGGKAVGKGLFAAFLKRLG